MRGPGKPSQVGSKKALQTPAPSFQILYEALAIAPIEVCRFSIGDNVWPKTFLENVLKKVLPTKQ